MVEQQISFTISEDVVKNIMLHTTMYQPNRAVKRAALNYIRISEEVKTLRKELSIAKRDTKTQMKLAEQKAENTRLHLEITALKRQLAEQEKIFAAIHKVAERKRNKTKKG